LLSIFSFLMQLCRLKILIDKKI